MKAAFLFRLKNREKERKEAVISKKVGTYQEFKKRRWIYGNGIINKGKRSKVIKKEQELVFIIR